MIRAVCAFLFVAGQSILYLFFDSLFWDDQNSMTFVYFSLSCVVIWNVLISTIEFRNKSVKWFVLTVISVLYMVSVIVRDHSIIFASVFFVAFLISSALIWLVVECLLPKRDR